MSNVVIVANKGYSLPVGECVLNKTEADSYIVTAAAKTGRGKGVKTVLRQFVIPKAAVAYMYKEKEVTPEEAAQYPSSNGVRAGVHATPAPAAAPKAEGGKRKRRTKAEMEAARAAEGGGKAPAEGKTKRKRRTKAEMEAARAAEKAAKKAEKAAKKAEGGGKAPKAEGKTKRKRRTKAEMEAARAAEGGGKAPAEGKTKRKRRTKAEMEAARAAEGGGKAPKAEPAAPAPAAPADAPAKNKGMSLFGDF